MSERPHPGPPELSDPRLTAMGLVFETQAGLRGAVEADLDRHGVTASAFEVLVRLARSPQQHLRMTDLAAQSTLSNSGLTRVIDRLLDHGYVVRERHDRDRRVFHAVITPHGLDLLARVLPSHLDVIDGAITSVLTPDELEAFTHALRKIRAVIKPSADPAAGALTSPRV